MKVTLGNTTIELNQSASLEEVLAQNGFSSQKGIAVAVNDTVISGKSWPTYQLQDGDKITVIKATAGG